MSVVSGLLSVAVYEMQQRGSQFPSPTTYIPQRTTDNGQLASENRRIFRIPGAGQANKALENGAIYVKL
jgi:hypothetical protein